MFTENQHTTSNLASVQVSVNDLLSKDRGDISDGYHTFNELYDHRITLYIKMCEFLSVLVFPPPIWKSRKHSDGTEWEGWFILGIGIEKGKQITYHLPISRWDECDFADELTAAPEWDGHTSNDVLERLKNL
jgi:hypothetical protein